jgi:hypothetical protein
MRIEGYRLGTHRDDRDVHLVRSEEIVNLDLLVLSELRVLAGMSRQKGA